jgi:diguanylate cyclase (GGDEF)-like protein
VLTPFLFFWPTWANKAKIGASLLLFVLYISLYLLSQVKGPVYFLDNWQTNLAMIFNVFIAFASFAAVSLYYQITTNEVEQKLREVNSRLVSLSRTDPLTDLNNRRTIVDRMGEEETRSHMNGETFSIIMSDIDHFKTFNDKYGHQFGDQVLISVADLLKSATRTKDVVARWGGEEFLILLPNTCGEEAKEVADRMRMVIAQTPLFLEGHEIHISMTFGVAECTSNIGINACIELADKALYKGKGNGRNQVVLIKSTTSQSVI